MATAAGAAAVLMRPSAITELEARQTFAAIRAGVTAEQSSPDPELFCAEFASNNTMCAGSLERVETAYPVGEIEPHSVELLRDGTALIRVEGKLSDRSSYRGFVQVVRDNGAVLAADPVFWTTRENSIRKRGENLALPPHAR